MNPWGDPATRARRPEGRRIPCTARLLLAPVLASVLAPSITGSAAAPAVSSPRKAAPPAGETPAVADRRAARQAVMRAQAAARAGDYRAALAAYEEALALRPSAKLYYNIGVCHQHIAGRARTSEERTSHLRAAVDAYNEYLRRRPDAEDRATVEATIEALGGVPDRPGIWEPANLRLFDPDAPPPALEDRTALWEEAAAAADSSRVRDDTPPHAPRPGPVAAPDPRTNAPNATKPPSSPAPPVATRPRAAVFAGVRAAALHPVDARRSAALDVPMALGGAAGGLARLGSRRRVLLGGEISFVYPIPIRADRYRVSRLEIAAFSGGWFEPGSRRRIALQAAAGLGVLVEALHGDGGAPPLSCPAGIGSVASRRVGVAIGARPALAVQFGGSRRHALVLAARPQVLLLAAGSMGSDCPDDAEDPFSEVGLPPGAAFGIDGALGYRVHF